MRKYPDSIQFTTILRGMDVDVEAINFDSDESVGIGFGPNDLIAKTKDGIGLELTEEEDFRLCNKAIDLWWESEPDQGPSEDDDWNWDSDGVILGGEREN